MDKPALGKTLRRIGLTIEVLAMLGIFALMRGKDEIWRGFPIEPSLFLRVSLGIGILIWVAGTILMYSGRNDLNRGER